MLHLTVQSRNLTNLKINKNKYENTRGENLGNFLKFNIYRSLPRKYTLQDSLSNGTTALYF